MLMPGVGFDVVPSDCLAAHVTERVPGATALRLAFKGITKPSRGTAKTIVENLERGCVVRRDGALVTLPAASLRRSIDYGDGRQLASMAVAWGDVATAYRTTRIANIEVYIPVPRAAQGFARLFGSLGVFASPRLKRLLVRRIDAGPAGPSDAERARGKSLLWACAEDASGARSAQAWLTTPEGYTLTAVAALEITRRVLAGGAKPGFRTPAGLFGADFVLQFEGVTRSDG
jgi:short subunit dehydrogenase-like uncharacterized protein